MWLKDGSCLGTRTWDNALDTAYDFNVNANSYACAGYNAQYTEWRLPNVKELESLINLGVSNNAVWLNSNNFVNVFSKKYLSPLNNYWSSTTFSGASDNAWSMSMYYSYIVSGPKSNTGHIMLTRGDSASLGKTGQTVSYRAGDDGDLQKGVSLPEPRFTDNGDGTVTDNHTGLMWLKDANCLKITTIEWDTAIDSFIALLPTA
ncbi:protein of unknown function DUF1566 [Candidatus Magnetoovum chiemensis]|nr:protein of unknown function DUF1566 [Candidatus Magnetoovum chiemensis]